MSKTTTCNPKMRSKLQIRAITLIKSSLISTRTETNDLQQHVFFSFVKTLKIHKKKLMLIA